MDADRRWDEPTRELPLRYGTHGGRLALSLCLLLSSGIALQFASVYTLGLFAWGVIGSVAGWIVVPARGWRRTVAIGPGVAGVVSLLGGATSGAFLALTLAAWLLVRQRHPATFALIVVPASVALLLGAIFPHYGWGFLIASVLGAVVIGCAWVARSLTAAASRRHSTITQHRSRSSPLK